MIDMTSYLALGGILSVLLALWPSIIMVLLNACYWLGFLLWSLGLIKLFSFAGIHWSSYFNIQLSYHVDNLTKVFVFLISAIGILVFLYSYYYFDQNAGKRAKLMAILQVFALGMLGIVVTNNFILLFVFWEITTITSYFLIQFDMASESANQAAQNSLLLSVLGSLVMLSGFVLLHGVTKSWSISYSMGYLTSHSIGLKLDVIFILLFIGAITKSAQFPFHFWLRGAMYAPTPVSAYLHSATMVNAGIYLLARVHVGFVGCALWYPCLATAGLITMLVSSYAAMLETDLKTILANTTLFVLGALVYLLASNIWLAGEAFVIFLIFHALYKAGCFMLAGVIDKMFATRDLKQLHGIGRKVPLLGALIVILFSAMAGLPPFFGFSLKQMIYEAKLSAPDISYLVMAISIITSMLVAAVSLRCIWKLVLCRYKGEVLKQGKKIGLIYPGVLAVAVIVFSVYQEQVRRLAEQAVSDVFVGLKANYLDPFSVNSLLLSLLTVVGGITLVVFASKMEFPGRVLFSWWNCRRAFEKTIGGLLAFGHYLTKITQETEITNQVRIMFAAIIIMLLPLVVASMSGLTVFDYQLPLSVISVAALVLMLVACISLCVTKKIILNLMSLGVVGLLMSFIFMVHGAADVAMTQLLIEILTIILIAIALRNESLMSHNYVSKLNVFNLFVALLFGALIFLLLSGVLSTPFNTQVQQFFIANSYSKAHGLNVVNVILVDFRALDTLGETLVIVATAIGIWLLMRNWRRARES